MSFVSQFRVTICILRHRIQGNAITYDKWLQKEKSYINSVCLTGCGFLRQYLLLQVEIIYCFIHFTVCIKFKNEITIFMQIQLSVMLKKGEEIHALLWEIKPFCFSTTRYTAELFMIWWNTNHFFTEKWIFEWFPQILFSLQMAANKRIAYYRNIYFSSDEQNAMFT